MTEAGRIRYRKLPGRLRGFVRGAGVWLGPDHLLAVRSTRFHEEYKRFYLRDIQAIVVADAPRYHVSTRDILIVIAFTVLWIVAPSAWEWRTMAYGTALIVMALGWLYLSVAASCRCRIHTAVSRDELPSLYRLRTARKFLARVDPLIGQAQGVLEGNWVEAVQQRVATSPTAPEARPKRGAARTWASDLLLAALFASAIVNYLLLRAGTRGLHWLAWGCSLVEAAAAAVIFVQRYRGRLQPAMQRLAIATLIVMGLMFYIQPMTVGMMAGLKASQPGVIPKVEMDEIGVVRGPAVFRQIEIGASVILGCVGLWILLRADDEPV